jgi:hypothetical protein
MYPLRAKSHRRIRHGKINCFPKSPINSTRRTKSQVSGRGCAHCMPLLHVNNFGDEMFENLEVNVDNGELGMAFVARDAS